MIPTLAPDLGWLVASLLSNVALLAVVLLLQPLVRDLTLGLAYTISSFDERRTESTLGRRLAMVRDNQMEALMLFAPLTLVAWTAGVTHPHLAIVAAVFLGARVAYALVSAAGVPLLRSLAWTVGFAATAYLGWIVWSGPGGAA